MPLRCADTKYLILGTKRGAGGERPDRAVGSTQYEVLVGASSAALTAYRVIAVNFLHYFAGILRRAAVRRPTRVGTSDDK